MGWLLRILVLDDERSPGADLDGGVRERLSSWLWDRGTSGIAEVGAHVLAGFDSAEQAHEIARRLVSDPDRPGDGAPDRGRFEVVGVEPAVWGGVAGSTVVELPPAPRARPGHPPTITIEPGTSFGHGGHPTTALALRLLAEEVGPGRSVLDVGTGSGVLAIAAAVLGAGPVVGVDIDPEAVRTARANAAANNVDVALTEGTLSDLAIERGAGPIESHGFDVVVANVLAPIQRELSPDLARLLADDGTLVVAGHLVADEVALSDLHARALGRDTSPVAIDHRRLDGWSAIRFRPMADPQPSAEGSISQARPSPSSSRP